MSRAALFSSNGAGDLCWMASNSYGYDETSGSKLSMNPIVSLDPSDSAIQTISRSSTGFDAVLSTMKGACPTVASETLPAVVQGGFGKQYLQNRPKL